MHIHVVQKGEVLWQIANYYNSNIDEIIELNNLENPDSLLVGQSLIIPTSETVYTVKPGENIWKIAQSVNVPVQELLWANRIVNPDLIYPGMVLNIPQKQRPEIEVNGFTYVLGEDAIPLVEEAGPFLTYLTPFAYVVQEDGSLIGIEDEAAIQEAIRQGVVPMMSIVNFTYGVSGDRRANVILNNPQIIETLQNNILQVMREKGYKGLNIDFEYVMPQDREAYNNFLADTVEKFHNEGYFVSTSLAPKYNDDQEGLLYEAHDYAAHGNLADFVILMTYEWGWRGGYPRAISPINEIEKVLDYAVTRIPREKILMGFQIYARDWEIPFVQGEEADTISIQDAMDIAYDNKVAIQYDYVAQSPNFRYTDNEGNAREVWFEDPRSAQAKFNLVKEYGLRGLSFWGLGYPFPQLWPLLDAKY